MAYELKIAHLYPDEMNLYGDLGNIIAIQKRCEWRSINTAVLDIGIAQNYDIAQADIVFMGGGQDRGQELIFKDLLSRANNIRAAAESGITFLLVCGGYQLFGKYFKTADQKEIPGIGILDCYTAAGERRMIGNIVTDIRASSHTWETPVSQLVGFENHSGKTYLGEGARPLGKVLSGGGNNGEDGTEGAIYKNCYGTYMHGSLLPKNPLFTDHLILSAMKRKYGREIEKLEPLDDTLELLAHEAAILHTKSK